MKLTHDQKRRLLEKAREMSMPKEPKEPEMLAFGGEVEDPQNDDDSDEDFKSLFEGESDQDEDAEDEGETKGFAQMLAERKSKSSIFRRRG